MILHSADLYVFQGMYDYAGMQEKLNFYTKQFTKKIHAKHIKCPFIGKNMTATNNLLEKNICKIQ